MSDELINQNESSYQNYTSNAYSVSGDSVSMESPAYSLTMEGENPAAASNSRTDLTDPEIAKQDYERLSQIGNHPRTTGVLSIYADYHPTFISKPCGDYRYWYDKDSMEPLFIGMRDSNNYVPFNKEFSDKVRDFVRNIKLKSDADKKKYIVWKDVQVTGGYKKLSGTYFWESDKEEISVNEFGISKSLSSSATEITLPGTPLGSIDLDLSKPYFGVDPKIAPNLNIGIAGIEFDVESKEVGISLGIEKNGIGVEVKIVGVVNTDKTSTEAQEYIAYDLLPWVGELADALGG